MSRVFFKLDKVIFLNPVLQRSKVLLTTSRTQMLQKACSVLACGWLHTGDPVVYKDSSLLWLSTGPGLEAEQTCFSESW